MERVEQNYVRYVWSRPCFSGTFYEQCLQRFVSMDLLNPSDNSEVCTPDNFESEVVDAFEAKNITRVKQILATMGWFLPDVLRAAWHNHLQLVEMMCDNDPSRKVMPDAVVNMAFDIALRNNHLDMAKLLRTRCYATGLNPLHHGIHQGTNEVISWLLMLEKDVAEKMLEIAMEEKNIEVQIQIQDFMQQQAAKREVEKQRAQRMRLQKKLQLREMPWKKLKQQARASKVKGWNRFKEIQRLELVDEIMKKLTF